MTMKTKLLLFLLFPLFAFSQEVATNSNKLEKRTTTLSDIHFGFNNFINSESNIVSETDYSLKSLNSVSLSLNYYAKTKIFKNNFFFLKYGLGLTSNNYKFSRQVQLIENENSISFLISDNEVKKSKLATLFLHCPLMIQLDLKNENDNSKFNLAIGPFIGYMLKAKSKFIYTDSAGKLNKEKEKSDFSLNKIRYGLQGEIGYINANFYFKYHLSSLFIDERGPEEITIVDFGLRSFITPLIKRIKKGD